jgi:hypothetical protein
LVGSLTVWIKSAERILERLASHCADIHPGAVIKLSLRFNLPGR